MNSGAPESGSSSPQSEDALERLRLDRSDWLDTIREAESAPPLGTMGRFRVLEEVGRGGQGVVYRAFDPHAQQIVALKRVLQGRFATEATLARFRREVDAAAALRHPGIVSPRALEHVDGEPILVMEWVSGVPVTDWARPRGAARPTREIVELFLRITAALRHAHQKGVIHRDLKPSNVLVDGSGAPHVLDFGAALFVPGSRAVTRLTEDHQFVGTLSHASPEQLGSGDVDIRTDIHALGLLLYESLTAEMPYPVAGEAHRVADAVRFQEARPIGDVRPDLPTSLCAIVHRALEKRPADRYQSTDSLLADLRRFLDGHGVSALSGEGVLISLWQTVRRHRVAAFVIGTVVLLLTGVASTMSALYREAHREARQAERTLDLFETALVPDGDPGAIDITLEGLLERVSALVDAGLDEDPEVEAAFRYRLIRVRSRLFAWQEAGREAAKALPLLRRVYGGKSSEVAFALHAIGMGATFQRDAGGIAAFEEALAIWRARGDILGEATMLCQLGFARWAAADPPDYPGAARSYAEGLAAFRRCRAGAHPGRAGALFSRAAMEVNRGDLQAAIPYYERALAMYEKLPHRLQHHETRCRIAYGHTLAKVGRAGDAEAALRRALAETPPGTDSGRIAAAIWRLGTILHARGERREASGLGARAFAEECEIAAMQHPDAASELHRLASETRTRGLERSTLAAAASLGDLGWMVPPAEFQLFLP